MESSSRSVPSGREAFVLRSRNSIHAANPFAALLCAKLFVFIKGFWWPRLSACARIPEEGFVLVQRIPVQDTERPFPKQPLEVGPTVAFSPWHLLELGCVCECACECACVCVSVGVCV